MTTTKSTKTDNDLKASAELIDKIDWFIFEDPSTAHYRTADGHEPLSDQQRDLVLLKNPDMTDIMVYVPTSRYEENSGTLTVSSPCTIGQFLNAVHAFYMKALTLEDVEKMTLDDQYYSTVLEKLQNGESAQMFELLGTSEIRLPNTDDVSNLNKRRDPQMCNGLVRFGGITDEVFRSADGCDYYKEIGLLLVP